jgi:hypothetical protein
MEMNLNYDVKSVLVSARIYRLRLNIAVPLSVSMAFIIVKTRVLFPTYLHFTEPRPNPLAAYSFSVPTVTELLAHFVSESSTPLQPNYQED